MHVGIPILASDLNVLREVAGDVARYVPPLDVRAWARALEDLIADEVGARDRAAAGRGRAREFTWNRTAATTVSAYRKVLTCA
jgi:glycosyltransferase involved in cell wall biosynthesis